MIRVRLRESTSRSKVRPDRVDGTVDDDVLAERVVAGGALGVADDQAERVDHRLMGGVAGAELEHPEEPDSARAGNGWCRRP
jgi:hypothetical protein